MRPVLAQHRGNAGRLMLIRFGFDITVACQQPTPMVCLLTLHDDRLGDLRAPETVLTTPEIPMSTYHDLFGNVCRRFVAPAGEFRIWGDGVVEDSGEIDPMFADAREWPVADLPDECLLYLMGSRYCETDSSARRRGTCSATSRRAGRASRRSATTSNRHITFGYHNARATRTAFEAHQERVGVCRDFAHLAITLCRCMNIPARYVNGYLGDIGVPVVDPMDFSAWIEVYLDGRWMTFDPRNNMPRIGRIVVARGRDAADIPLINSFGPHVLNSFRVWAYEVPQA